MRIKSLQLQNFRSFENMGPIEFKQVNILIGPNNAGKSSILKALHLMQEGCGAIYPDVRVGSKTAFIGIRLEDTAKRWSGHDSPILSIHLHSDDRVNGTISFKLKKTLDNDNSSSFDPLKNIEPYHFVVPFLSKRKTSHYQEDVRNEYALRVTTDMSFLAAKLSRLANPGFPSYERYSSACKALLGFVVTAIPSANGQRPGVYLSDRQTIPIDQMGEGVPNIVALLADLALSEGKLILIEEPENDLHPQALKALLELIVESSKSNQFVISTHSNIVVRHLAAETDSILYHVNSEAGKLPPVATIRPIEQTVEARMDVLRELGYAFSDFDLWDGWLILEESSAERIIRDYLIPWFAPKLARVRTIAVGGVTQVEPTFDDFHRLVRFTHLEEAYRNSVWVRIDGDEIGFKIITQLQGKYSSWKSDRFACFSKAKFELYYPKYFDKEVTSVLAIEEKQARREAKRRLLNDVRVWLDEDEQRGKEALQISAAEIISDLKLVERQLLE